MIVLVLVLFECEKLWGSLLYKEMYATAIQENAVGALVFESICVCACLACFCTVQQLGHNKVYGLHFCPIRSPQYDSLLDRGKPGDNC